MPPAGEKRDWVVRRADGVTYVELPRERLVNPSDMERICAAVDEAIKASDKPKVVMSFTNVKHIPSLFLGKIMSFNKQVLAKGGSFALTNVNSDLMEMLRVTKVTKLVKIIDSPQGGSALGKIGAMIKSITGQGPK